MAGRGTSSGGEVSVSGRYFSASGLPNNWIKGLFRDESRLPVTAGDDRTGRTVVLDPGSDRFVPFEPGPGFLGERITGWAGYGGSTCAATESALNIRRGSGWTHLEAFGPIRHSGEFPFSDARSIYAVARVMFGGILSFGGKEWRTVDRGPGTGIMNNTTSIIADGDTLSIGTTTNGLFRFDGRDGKMIGAAEGLPGICVTSLALLAGGATRAFSESDGLPSRMIRILKTVKGTLVAGTADAGLSIRTAAGRFETLSTEISRSVLPTLAIRWQWRRRERQSGMCTWTAAGLDPP